MENRKILLVGDGGHCKSVLDSLLTNNEYEDIGIIAKAASYKGSLLGITIVGTDADLPNLFAAGWTDAFVTLGSVGNPARRQQLYLKLKQIGFRLPAIVDSSAVIGRNVSLAAGVFIGKRAVINTAVHIGACAIINSGAIIEHDCNIGDFVHAGPGCILCGGVTVGADTHIGAGSVVRQQIQIGCNSLIGAGSVVVSAVPDNCEAYGNPCRVVKKL